MRGATRITLTGGLCAMLMVPAAGATSADGEAAVSDDLLIVDCLLPGQIRRLGARTTYVSARQPQRTTARDCHLRGGEYVSYDRADYQTSLAVWLPPAREGDNEARVNVGTIFERGLGREPDYAAAAHWYALAAEDGHIEAQLKLAHLYEVGLGVPRDAGESLRWYREAMGIGDVQLDLTPAAGGRAPERALSAFQAELTAMQKENADLRSLLEESGRRVAEAELGAPHLEARVDSLEAELVRRDEALNTLEQRYDRARRQYLEAVGERDSARAGLEEAVRAAEASRRRDQQALNRQTETIETLERALRDKEQAQSREQREVQTLERKLIELEQNLKAAAAERGAVRQAAVEGLLTGPSLTMIDPRLPRTRGLVKIAVPAVERQQLVGRVEAPAGLLALTLNGAPLETNQSGVFMTNVAVRGTTAVALAAIDAQGKRTDLTFELDAGGQPAAVSSARERYDDLDLGTFHALVIGNDDYRHLPKLKTAVHDARAMSRLLGERYGFRTRLLVNADRYAILSALNDYRERLSSDDNLLIYYAGHGELDEVNMRGHWLPVDAEAQSTANWISNVAVTDVLNVMRARHVMLIADSCYSASLTRSSVARLGAGMTDAERRNWIRTMSGKRARLALSSGGLAPVLDAGGGRHSVFAKALLEVLADNDALLDGRELYEAVAARVAYAASNVQFEQVPEFGPIRHAGHEAGAFFLVPRKI